MQNRLWKHVERVRSASPLVHSITNFVVMNNTANAVLAVGASPIMSHAHSEVEAMVALCGATVVNIGTLDEYWAETMIRAAREAGRLGKPWLFDPVGAGATPYRDEVSARILALRPTVIRGNASEIMALASANATATKGVDSTAASGEAVAAARRLNREFGSVVCVSGETDIIVGHAADNYDRSKYSLTECRPSSKAVEVSCEGGSHESAIDGVRVSYIHNGSTLMTRVTGLGCSCSAVIGAFIAAADAEEGDTLEAVAAATALFALCGEIAAENAPGPGTLQLALLDKLYNITEEEFLTRLKFADMKIFE